MGINLTNTETVANAVAIMAAKGKSAAKTLTPEQQEGKDKTLAHLGARAEEGTRVTYARFAELAIANGWIGESGLSNGQRGSGLISQVPLDHQAFVCQSSGRYSAKAKAKFVDHLPIVDGASTEQVFGILRFLPAEGPKGVVKTFEPKARAPKAVKAEQELSAL